MTCSLRTSKLNKSCGQKLNETMLKHGFPKLNFKGFMIDNAQAN